MNQRASDMARRFLPCSSRDLAALLLGASMFFAVVPHSAFAVTPSKEREGRRQAIDLLAEGVSHEEAGDLKTAISLYQQSVQLAPSPAGYYQLGHAYARAGQKDAARQYLRQALELNPNYELARSELASLGGAKTDKKVKVGAGKAMASAGGDGSLVGVDQTLAGARLRADAAGNADIEARRGAININEVQQESETLRSLKKPRTGPDGSVPPEKPKPLPPSGPMELDPVLAGGDAAIPSLGAAGQGLDGQQLAQLPVPAGPARPGAGSPAGVPAGPTQATPGIPARNSLIPPDTIVLQPDSQAKVLDPGGKPVNHGDQPLPKNAPSTTGAERTGIRGARATPEAGATPAQGAIRSGGASPAADAGLTGDQPPLGSSSAEKSNATPRIAGSADAGTGGGSASAPAAGGAGATAAGGASIKAINDAAFGPQDEKFKASTGYNSRTKVALGTYAFHRDQADKYRSTGRYEDAAREYQTALELEPTNAETRALYAEMMARTGNNGAANRQFDKAQAYDPSDARSYYKQGNAYRDQGKYEQAISSYLKALSVDPDDKFALNNLGVVYMEQGEYAKAAARLKRVVAIDPNYANALMNLGILYDDHLDDKSLALSYYDRYLATGAADRRAEVQRWAEAIRKEGGTPSGGATAAGGPGSAGAKAATATVPVAR